MPFLGMQKKFKKFFIFLKPLEVLIRIDSNRTEKDCKKEKSKGEELTL